VSGLNGFKKRLQEFLNSDHWLRRYCILSGVVFYFEPPCIANITEPRLSSLQSSNASDSASHLPFPWPYPPSLCFHPHCPLSQCCCLEESSCPRGPIFKSLFLSLKLDSLSLSSSLSLKSLTTTLPAFLPLPPSPPHSLPSFHSVGGVA